MKKYNNQAKISLGLLAVTASLVSAVALAETTTTTSIPTPSSSGTSTTSLKSETALDHIGVTYFGIFSGPSVGTPNRFQPDSQGALDPTSPQQLESFLTTGYKWDNGNKLVGAVADFIYTPFNGQDLMMKDPAFKIGDKKLWTLGGVTDNADLRIFAPTSAAAVKGKEITAFQTLHIVSYDVPHSRLSLGTYFVAKLSLYQDGGSGKAFQLYLGPNASYQLSKTVQATLLYEVNAKHMYGSNVGFWDMSRDGTDLEPGINWDITPNFSINPFLNINSGGKVSMDSTWAGFYASGKFL